MIHQHNQYNYRNPSRIGIRVLYIHVHHHYYLIHQAEILHDKIHLLDNKIFLNQRHNTKISIVKYVVGRIIERLIAFINIQLAV